MKPRRFGSRWSVLKWKEIWEFMVSMATESSSSWMHRLHRQSLLHRTLTQIAPVKTVLLTRMNWFVGLSAVKGLLGRNCWDSAKEIIGTDTYRMYKHLECYPTDNFFLVHVGSCCFIQFSSRVCKDQFKSVSDCNLPKPITKKYDGEWLNFIFDIISALTKTRVLITLEDFEFA